jgi:hypothetical protein
MDCLEMTRAEMQHDLEVFEKFAWGLVAVILGACVAGVIAAMILH